MNERDALIFELIKEKGGTKEQYLHLLNSIANHESAGTMNPAMKQIGGGPGRGKYQFEHGRHKGGITAANRTKRYLQQLNKPVPRWLQEATKGDNLDVSNLTSEQQDILFLGNMRQHPKADLGKVVSGETSIPRFWADHHWSGPKSEKTRRIKNFNKTYEPYVEDDDIGKQHSIESDAPYNKFESGGNMNTLSDDKFNSFNVGGKHEQNPHGGIPQGMGQNGKLNTVEEGETSFTIPDIGKYIFSDRLKI